MPTPVHQALEAAVEALAAEQERLSQSPPVLAAYDQGRVDELTRNLAILSERMDQLRSIGRHAVAAELAILRTALLDQ